MTDPALAAARPRRLLLLANPRARNGAAAGDLVAPLAALGLEVVFAEPDGIEALLATIRTTGRAVDRIAIAGGDGSIAAALPALLEVQKPLAVLPLGTANDLARNLRLPDDQAARLRLVAGGVVRRIDLARVNGRPVLNAVSIGLGAAVATLHTGRAKQLLGVLNYPRVLYAAWRRIHPFGVEITCDGVAHRGRFIHVAVVNGRFHGGGIEPRPTGTITDGLLDLYALRDGPVFRLMQIMAKLKIEGAESDQAFRLQGTRIRHRHLPPAPCQYRRRADQAGHRSRHRDHARALAVVVPAGSAPGDF
ncbi:MAG: diacylglycerol kinase family protein [Geminicoccaceae bacterium]